MYSVLITYLGRKTSVPVTSTVITDSAVDRKRLRGGWGMGTFAFVPNPGCSILLDPIGLWSCYVILYPWWFFVQLFYQLLRKGLKVCKYNCKFVDFSCLFHKFVASHILQLCCFAHRHLKCLCLFNRLTSFFFRNKYNLLYFTPLVAF